MTHNFDTNREGFALVTTLLIVLVLSVLAVGIVWLASAEKKITHAESVHINSMFSADAGGEAGINFIRMSNSAPAWSGPTQVVETKGTTAIVGSQTYDYETQLAEISPGTGWEIGGGGYAFFDYRISSHGTASTNGESGVNLVASRLFKQGY